MKLLLLHFIYGSMTMGIGLYVGRIMEVTKQLKNQTWKMDQMFMEGFTQKASCQFCPDNDLMMNHPICLKCCYQAIRDLRIFVPYSSWLQGAKSYDWAGHFELLYKTHHKKHLTCEPTIICPTCKTVSFNTNDIKYKYCGKCFQFHDQMKPT